MSKKAQFLVEHEQGELGAALIEEGYCADVEEAIEKLEEHYHGEWDSERDFAISCFEYCYDVPEYLQEYINYEAFAYDLFIGDYFSIELNSRTHIFSSH